MNQKFAIKNNSPMKMTCFLLFTFGLFLFFPGFTCAQTGDKINVVPGLTEGTLKKENLGKQINTKYSEYVPVISPDGKTLYMYVKNDPSNVGEGDIWFSKLQDDGAWGKRQHLEGRLNNEFDNFVISVSPDNNTLFLSRRYKYRNGMTFDNGVGFSISHRTRSGWSVPADLKIEKFRNKSKYGEFCLSSDKKTLLHAIEGRDSKGKQDLYVSFLQEDDTWTEPMNLGDINTESSENSPFLASDGVTLYFATDGRPGYGQTDIFMTRRLDDTWKRWTKPENLGPDINSPKRDAYFTIPASGEYAYLVSDENSYGQADIFRVKLPDIIKPRPVVLIYGKVLNSENNQPLEAHITYRDLETDREMGIARSDPKTGDYKIILPAGIRYSFYARKKDIITVSENIDVSKVKNYKEIQRDLYLTPIKVGSIVVLNNLWFKTGKDEINRLSFPELGRLIELLEKNPTMKIEIRGHTDNTGSDEINIRLSKERADAVRNYLIQQGLKQERMQAKGYSYTIPIASNRTVEGRRKNRRVDFKILSL